MNRRLLQHISIYFFCNDGQERTDIRDFGSNRNGEEMCLKDL
jgi:hypothetical protein